MNQLEEGTIISCMHGPNAEEAAFQRELVWTNTVIIIREYMGRSKIYVENSSSMEGYLNQLSERSMDRNEVLEEYIIQCQRM
jgi:hypothetical protein